MKLYIHLKKKKVDSGLCSQILDIGTSIGADVEDAIGGSSRKDFISKLQIAYKEAQSDKARYHTKIKITVHEVETS